jgi:hypothetical protein
VNRDAIDRYLHFGDRALEVDVSLAAEFPGYVRTVALFGPAGVRVEFEPHGLDEGGATFEGRFGSLDEAIAAVEEYLGEPLWAWHNYSASGEYPHRPHGADLAEGARRLDEAIRAGRVPLPRGPFNLTAGNRSKLTAP